MKNILKQLSDEELQETLTWLDKFDLTRPRKAINRDFSDAVPIAEILKQLYPKLVEIHNYPPRNSYNLKLDNWRTLNRKVLRKIGLSQPDTILDQLCRATPNAIESLLREVMIKYKIDMQHNKINELICEESENSDILMVNVERIVGPNIENAQQKMILYSIYEKSQETVEEQKQAIAILLQKIEHLDNMLKLKAKRIEDLSFRLARKSRIISLPNNDNIEVILDPPSLCNE